MEEIHGMDMILLFLEWEIKNFQQCVPITKQDEGMLTKEEQVLQFTVLTAGKRNIFLKTASDLIFSKQQMQNDMPQCLCF